MDITTLGTVTAIVAICYLIGMAVKAIPNIKIGRASCRERV